MSYPFKHPRDTTDIEALYDGLISKLTADDGYCRPITVIARQTLTQDGLKGTELETFLDEHVRPHSYVEETWSVDTCQRWLAGFGRALDGTDDQSGLRNQAGDVYWHIPSDFNYGTAIGQQALAMMRTIPAKVRDGRCDLCLGEITVPNNRSKQLIDTYGTYGLLYNWFPAEAKRIRETTEKPRSEFFAINYSFLQTVLLERWYAYEQMLVRVRA